MTVKEFVDGYNKTSENLKTRYIKEKLEIKDYISFSDKCSLVDRIVSSTIYEHDINGNITNNIHVDSLLRFMIFTLEMVNTYTNIDINFTEALNEYDLLDSNGLFELFIGESGIIPFNEYNKMQTMLNMKLNDVLQNRLSTHAFVQDQVTRFGTLTGVAISPIIGKLEHFIDTMDDDKFNRIASIVEKYISNRLK